MVDVTGMEQAEMYKEILIGGTKLIVIASRINSYEWKVSVQNEYGISSNWTEYFPSAQLAIDTAVKAIENEGVEAFLDKEGFEYLFH